VAAVRGHSVAAARLWGVSEAVREDFDIELTPMARSFTGYENNLSAARSQLGEAAFAAAWAEGKDMTIEEATEYALFFWEEGPASPLSASLADQKAPAGKQTVALTCREDEIAALVARGLTNRRIAEKLTLSERTVDTHVSRILKKLGVRSREQIADLMSEPRLQDTN
jgi:DNA-binding NarL/FixJ family response regulator